MENLPLTAGFFSKALLPAHRRDCFWVQSQTQRTDKCLQTDLPSIVIYLRGEQEGNFRQSILQLTHIELSCFGTECNMTHRVIIYRQSFTRLNQPTRRCCVGIISTIRLEAWPSVCPVHHSPSTNLKITALPQMIRQLHGLGRQPIRHGFN